MSILTWFTRNWADTREPGDQTLVPLVLSFPVAETLAGVQTALATLPGWQVQQVDAAGGVIQATRTTRFWRFVDDVTIQLEPLPAGTLVQARSQSRVGRGDLGQNRRNLLEFFHALRSWSDNHSAPAKDTLP